MVRATTSRLGEIFVREGLITPEQLEEALEKQRQSRTQTPLGDILVSMGLISERDKVRCLAIDWNVEFIDLTETPPDPEVAKMLPAEMARKLRSIPVAVRNGRLLVATRAPLNVFAMDEIRAVTGMEVDPAFATEDDLNAAIDTVYQAESQLVQEFTDLIQGLDEAGEVTVSTESAADEISIDQLREMSSDAPIVRFANLIIEQGLQNKASDIHVEPGKTAVRVRYRVDGILHDGLLIPKQYQASLISRLKIMSNMDISQKRIPQDGRVSTRYDGKEYDFRVSTLPGVFGEKVVLRILDKSALNLGLNRLGMLPATLEKFENLISRTYGIILVTGPTGSGKSTTLYSVLNKLNTEERNIITLEDPVEYNIPGITQVNVNVQAGLTFAAGLRAILRQDPDIVMVGEIRDAETATIACEAALTGHLVLSTLHTNDAPSAATRLIDLGVEPFLISSAVIGVLAQRLVRLICPRCKEEYQPPASALSRLGFDVSNGEQVKFYRGAGCYHCSRKGYRGRIGVYELMLINDEIRELILRKSSSIDIKEAAVRSGMITLKDDVLEKILLGLTTLEEALRVIYAG
jgi:type IV pilus assembly protein PilB